MLDQLSRVAIVGTSCAGKSTLARELSTALTAPHIELDALHWGPNWTTRPAETFRANVDAATSEGRWVCDGNYRIVRDLVWPRASTIVWLNFPFHVVCRRALSRTIRRSVFRTRLYSDNRETLLKSFFSRDSILLWVLKSYRSGKREYDEVLSNPPNPLTHVVQLNSPAAAEAFLAEVRQRAACQVR
jgi:adenylate kinase family enzyme